VRRKRGQTHFPGLGSGNKCVCPLFVLFLVNVLNFYDRQALGAVLEPLRREFHLSDARLGALTTIFTVLYAVAGCPWGGWRIPGAADACWLSG
jgi:hypothetical protein